ncbi:MAG: single-stranded DNA-binding protein [Methylocella sp.]
MSAQAMILGVIFRGPERKIGKSGKHYVDATARVRDGAEGTQFWRIRSFSESACADLMRLREGDSLSAQGSLQVEIYQKAGEPKLSYSMVADAILPLRAPRKDRKPVADRKGPSPAQTAQQTLAKSHQRPISVAEFDDTTPPWEA